MNYTDPYMLSALNIRNSYKYFVGICLVIRALQVTLARHKKYRVGSRTAPAKYLTTYSSQFTLNLFRNNFC